MTTIFLNNTYKSIFCTLVLLFSITASQTLSAATLAAGGYHTCMVKNDGTLACWGLNDDGRATSPSGTFSQLSVGWDHACALRTDATLICWGRNESGQPAPVVGSFSQISAGYDYTCALKTDATLACWGDNLMIPPTGTFTQISTGWYHACGIKTDGTLACWGKNDYQQATPPEGTFLQVTANGYHSCGIKTDSTVVCWGNTNRNQASPPAGAFTQIVAGFWYTCGIKTDGTLACWGDNDYGQALPPTGSFVQLSAGLQHACGVRTDGTVTCWGDDSKAQATPPPELSIAEQTVTVNQVGEADCTYTVTPTTATHGYGSETATLTITAPANCPWIATTSNDGWIRITSGNSGQGNGTITYSVAGNTGFGMISPYIPSKNRTGTMTIAEQTVTINQVGEADCTYTVTPTTVTHGYGSETGDIIITAPAGCPWEATSNEEWITITYEKGKGEGVAGYSVNSNSSLPSQSRSGTISVAGQTVTITQYATLVQAVGIITTVAGNGKSGSYEGVSGDGGAAISTGFNPRSITIDSNGNLYIAEGSRIRKVDTAGIITTVAGNDKNGFSGDGGPATGAQLFGPTGVTIDSIGNLYVVGGNRIRKVDTTGIITTIAGNGMTGSSGDGGPATSAQLCLPMSVAVDSIGNLYVADSGCNRIRKIDTAGNISTVVGGYDGWGFSGDGGPATGAQLGHVERVAVDSRGNLYIADFINNRIRKVDTAGIISTVAGNGVEGYRGDGGAAIDAQLDNPKGVTVDSLGNLYIADSGNDRIRKVDAAGIISTVAGNGIVTANESVSPGPLPASFSGDGGPAINAQLDNPIDVAVDSNGNLYIADSNNNRIRKVTFSNSTQPKVEVVNPIVSQTIYQTGETLRVTLPSLPAGQEQYIGIGLPNGSLYLLNQLNSFIPFDNVTFPVWPGGEVAIDRPITADLPNGLYTVYLLRMPTGVSPSSVKMEDWALGTAVFTIDII